MANDVTDELLKLSSLEDNKENRDCQFIKFLFVCCYNICISISMLRLTNCLSAIVKKKKIIQDETTRKISSYYLFKLLNDFIL